MELDEANDIDDVTSETILALSRRLERSRTDEQIIYRESELDELWRLIDIAPGLFGATGMAPLAIVKQAVWDAHELLAAGASPIEAAIRLKSALA